MGDPLCPCLAAPAFGGLAIIDNVIYNYTSSYGHGCALHDAGTAPFCALDMTCKAARGANHTLPGWCLGSWCYVDASTCKLSDVAPSSYGAELHYSYSTCGSFCGDTFESFFVSSVSDSTINGLGESMGITAGCLIVFFVLMALYIRRSVRLLHQRAAHLSDARVRHVSSGAEGIPHPLREGEMFHLFLSHSWIHGQDQMRLVKERLTAQLLPGLRVFLDVDDLEEGRGTEDVNRSQHILIFLTEDYFDSKNCFCELLCAFVKSKPITVMLETQDGKHGGIQFSKAMAKLKEACRNAVGKWELAEELIRTRRWQSDGKTFALPTEDELYRDLSAALRGCCVIAFDRMPCFLDVSMRTLCESLVEPPRPRCDLLSPSWRLTMSSRVSSTSVDSIDASDVNPDTVPLYLRRELTRKEPSKAPEPRQGMKHHLYYSVHNGPNAGRLISELCDLQVQGHRLGRGLSVTSSFVELKKCEHMLVLLDANTWTRGAISVEFAKEVKAALKNNIILLLAHERPNLLEEDADDSQRAPTPFERFFSCADGTTPLNLLKCGIYNSVAVPLSGGRLRPTSLVMPGLARCGPMETACSADLRSALAILQVARAAEFKWPRPRYHTGAR